MKKSHVRNFHAEPPQKQKRASSENEEARLGAKNAHSIGR